MTALRTLLPGGRLHFQHGPMDIVIGAEGDLDAVEAAHARAWERFRSILDELVSELALLRQPVGGDCPVRGPVARRMWHACVPFAGQFITPMAAVAGSVAQELIGCYAGDGMRRAWVNNGGDIALHLAPAQAVRVGLYADLAKLDVREVAQGIDIDGRFEVASRMPVRGIATSGWRGRSFSLGIADSVTVLARTAAQADAAATVIANAVDTADARIVRRPANQLKDDTDLGVLSVTVDVPALEPALVARALDAGLQRARELRSAGLIWSAALVCQRQVMTTSSDGIGMLEMHGAKRQAGSVFA